MSTLTFDAADLVDGAGAWDLPHLDWRRPRGGVTAVRFALGALDPGAAITRRLLARDGRADVVAVLGAGLGGAWPDAGAAVGAYCAAHGDALTLVAPAAPVARAAPALVEAVGRGAPVSVLAIGDDDTRRAVAAALGARRAQATLVHLPTTLGGQADGGVGDADAATRPDAVLCDFELLRLGDHASRREGLALALEAALLGDPAFLRWIEHQVQDIRAGSIPVLAWTVHRTAQLRIAAARGDGPATWPSWSLLRRPGDADMRAARLAVALVRLATAGGAGLGEAERRRVLRLLDALGIRARGSAGEAPRRAAREAERQAEHRA